MTIHRCPYCHETVGLPKYRIRPPRVRRVNARCPHCSKMMWYKTVPGTATKQLVTTDQAVRICIIEKNLVQPGTILTLKIEFPLRIEPPKPARPLATLSGDEILREIKDK